MTTSKWTYYTPARDGKPPADYLPGQDVEVQTVSGRWHKTTNPAWVMGADYRYKLPDAQPSPDRPSLPEEGRDEFPMADGLLDYFPNALAEVARWSKIGNDKHNPGQPMHWNRDKSTDHRNKIARHLIDAGKRDKDGNRHSAALAWRALANLQEELEREEGFPMPRNARRG